MDFRVEPSESKTSGPCDCCGHTSRTAWGLVHVPDGAVSAYYVHWTEGRQDHGAHFDLILGPWGEGTSAADRVSVALEYRVVEGTPGFMVIDAGSKPIAQSDLAGRALDRDEVLGTAWDDCYQPFAIVDAIWLQDGRLAEVTGWA